MEMLKTVLVDLILSGRCLLTSLIEEMILILMKIWLDVILCLPALISTTRISSDSFCNIILSVTTAPTKHLLVCHLTHPGWSPTRDSLMLSTNGWITSWQLIMMFTLSPSFRFVIVFFKFSRKFIIFIKSRLSSGCKTLLEHNHWEILQSGRISVQWRGSLTAPCPMPAPWPLGNCPEKPYVYTPALSAQRTIPGSKTQLEMVSLSELLPHPSGHFALMTLWYLFRYKLYE